MTQFSQFAELTTRDLQLQSTNPSTSIKSNRTQCAYVKDLYQCVYFWNFWVWKQSVYLPVVKHPIETILVNDLHDRNNFDLIFVIYSADKEENPFRQNTFRLALCHHPSPNPVCTDFFSRIFSLSISLGS